MEREIIQQLRNSSLWKDANNHYTIAAQSGFNYACAKLEVILQEKGIDYRCQNDIEGRRCCAVQCEHCKAYYAPLYVGRKADEALIMGILQNNYWEDSTGLNQYFDFDKATRELSEFFCKKLENKNNKNMNKGFHLQSGYYFTRQVNGDVTIARYDGDKLLSEFTVQDSEWASLVAAMSKQGETSETFKQALNFHNAIQQEEDREKIWKDVMYKVFEVQIQDGAEMSNLVDNLKQHFTIQRK